MKRLQALAMAVVLLASTLRSYGQGQFSGYVFGDYYRIVSNHRSELKGKNGFWIRRAYFTYDRKLGENVSSRLRFEMNHPGNFTSGQATPYVKDAYVAWKLGLHQVVLGISPTPTYAKIEDLWGYRAVEKTPLDLHKLADSRDFGLAVKGKLSPDGGLSYHFMLGNENGVGAENDAGKCVMLALGMQPIRSLYLELFAGANFHKESDSRILQAFVAYLVAGSQFGLQYSDYREEQGSKETRVRLVSGFVTTRIASDLKLFGRVDRLFDPNPAGDRISYLPMDPLAKSTLLILGADYGKSPDVRIMPNVEVVKYGARPGGQKPATDLIPRLTFYFAL